MLNKNSVVEVRNRTTGRSSLGNSAKLKPVPSQDFVDAFMTAAFAPAEHAAPPARVIIAEDETPESHLATEHLERRGMRVHRIARPDRIVAAVKRYRPDVLVMADQFRNYRFNFEKILEKLAEEAPEVCVILTYRDSRTRPLSVRSVRSAGAFTALSRDSLRDSDTLEDAITTALRQSV